MAVLALLLAMTTVYYSSDKCPGSPTAAVVATDDGDDTVDDTDDGVVDVGDDEGKLVIYEFSEFQCPYCAAAAGLNEDLKEMFKSQDPTWDASVPKIKEEYGDEFRVEFKHFIVHDSAKLASEAAECARDQGKFWEMHDAMFENMASLESDDLKALAADIGLDTDDFNACLDSGEKTAIVEADTALGRELGVSGTPTFFVGGEEGYKVVGAQSYTAFIDPIEKVLAGEMPPKALEPIGTFQGVDNEVCTEDGKPVIRLFTTTWCPHCTWVGPAFDEVMKEYMDAGKIVAYHWEVDTGDNSLTDEVETEVPESELEVYSEFNPRGSIPTFVFGCKYYRIGTGYEVEDDLEAEANEFREILDTLIAEVGA
jgi:protein-disulfide isomerase/thiol-disulfide isomerase/thioredoxin